MESILAILCIIFFCYLTHIIIKGINENKDHIHNCKTLFIPENLDIDASFESIKGLNRSQLKKRARQLGASKEFVDKTNNLDLKIYIIQGSISQDHILTINIDNELKKIENEEITETEYNKLYQSIITMDDLKDL
tara:strand:- start:20 stop:424 length:405 start_codon:yes stop_codon:yes gene_type:complete